MRPRRPSSVSGDEAARLAGAVHRAWMEILT
jgi:hypothetical protein